MNDGPPEQPPSSDDTRILRRQPEALSTPRPAVDEPQTSIIRRAPTGALPAVPADPQTSYIEPVAEAKTGYVPQPRPHTIARTAPAGPGAAVAAAVVAILSGWATAVIATDLITGWWRPNRLFCVAVGFLAAVSAAATIGGLVALLLRRRLGRLLIVVGAVIALMIFASLFVAEATLPPAVYGIPVLPLATIVLTVLPATRRWARS